MFENKINLHLVYFQSPSACTTADTPLSDVGCKHYVALVFWGKSISSSADWNSLVNGST